MHFKKIEMFSLHADCIVLHLFLLHEYRPLSFFFCLLFSFQKLLPSLS